MTGVGCIPCQKMLRPGICRASRCGICFPTQLWLPAFSPCTASCARAPERCGSHRERCFHRPRSRRNPGICQGTCVLGSERFSGSACLVLVQTGFAGSFRTHGCYLSRHGSRIDLFGRVAVCGIHSPRRRTSGTGPFPLPLVQHSTGCIFPVLCIVAAFLWS